jgi:hypothetical protein
MRMSIQLSREELERLVEIARSERRRPQEQAAVLLVQALNGKPEDSNTITNSANAADRAPLAAARQ